jgi:pyruvate dehydrogenase E1 component beta subunit
MKTTFAGALNRALREEMERDPSVLMIGLDIARMGGIFGVTKGLLDKFGKERVIDTPISETGFTGAAVGMAMEGLRPVVEIQFADFVTVTFDQITTVASKMHYITGGNVKVPMVIRLPYGVNMSGGYMTGAGPHHSQSLEAWFCHCAGLKVVMPSSAADAMGLMKAAIRDNNPVVFCEQKGLYFVSEDVPDEEHVIPLGTAAVKREGKDATIVATGVTVGMALKVADRLAAQKISVEVIDPRTLIPLDTKTIFASVKKTGRVVITQEASQTMGFCSEVAAVIAEGAFASLKAPVRRVGALDMPIPAGDAAMGMLPTEARIEEAVRSVLH